MIYIHVPFCFSKCSYCGFYSKVALCGEHETYLKRLEEEAKERLDKQNFDFDTVFVGGGNPTCLGFEGLKKLLNIVSKHIDINKVSEFSFETNPETLNSDIIDLLAEIPNIRLSMGVQRLKDSELKILGRNANLKSVYNALDKVFNKISNVNCDFIMGVPSCPSIANDLSNLVQKYPLKHISAYFLTLEEGTKLAKMVENGELEDPDDIDASELYDIRKILLSEKFGFKHYEISNYAKEGFECRHNLGYWQNKDYIGLGPSAVSSIGNRRISNVSDFNLWLNGSEPEIENLTDIDRRNEYVMLHLRLLEKGLDLTELEKKFGKQNDEFYQLVENLLKSVQLLKTGSILKLAPQSIAYANNIISDLFI